MWLIFHFDFWNSLAIVDYYGQYEGKIDNLENSVYFKEFFACRAVSTLFRCQWKTKVK